MKDGNNMLSDIGRRINQCKTPQEVDDLVRPMDTFLQEGKPKQEERLRKISELAVELYGKWRKVAKSKGEIMLNVFAYRNKYWSHKISEN